MNEPGKLLPWDLPLDFRDTPVVLTPHPLQRVGAFALTALADRTHPQEIPWSELSTGLWEEITQPLLDVARLSDSKQPGGFWLAASYMLWPNSKMNTTNRKKLSVQELHTATAQWRTLPSPPEWPEAPCVLCARPACGFFGKVDVPLGASVEYSNATVPGHPGMALCVGCVASFYALPWGCLVHKGRLSLVHSFDDDFLGETVSEQVAHTRRQSWSLPSGGFEREQLVLQQVRSYSRPIRADVSLLVFTNSNQEQELTEYLMRQSLTSWIKRTLWNNRRQDAYVSLERSGGTAKVSGAGHLASLLLRHPDRLGRLIAAAVYRRTQKHRPVAVPATSVGLHELLSSYCREVMLVSEQRVQEIEALGARAADVIELESQKLKPFTVAYRTPRGLRKWLESATVSWLTLPREQKVTEPFVTPRLMKALFDYSDEAWLNRQLLFTAVLAELQRRGFAPEPEDGQESQDLMDDDVDSVTQEENPDEDKELA